MASKGCCSVALILTTFLASDAHDRKCFVLGYMPASQPMISRLWRCRTGRCGSMPPGVADIRSPQVPQIAGRGRDGHC